MLTITLTESLGHTRVVRSFAEADALLRRLCSKRQAAHSAVLRVALMTQGGCPLLEQDIRLDQLPLASHDMLRSHLVRSLQSQQLSATNCHPLLRQLTTLN